MDNNDAEYDEKVFKVIIVGDSATGKTSILQRYTTSKFSEKYKTTVYYIIIFCLMTLPIFLQNVFLKTDWGGLSCSNSDMG